MFFICGIDTRTKEIPYSKTVICAQCGGYGRYQVFMTYSCLSLFFIPIFKWNRHYYVRMSCCDTLYEMSQELGKRIAGGDLVDITESSLTLVQSGRRKENAAVTVATRRRKILSIVRNAGRNFKLER